MLNFVFILALSLTVLHNVTAICHECYPNGVACISDKKFQYCVKGKVNTSVTFSCLGENEICTNHSRVCLNKTLTSATQACGAKFNCGKCEGKQDDGKYSCTSRTTFTICSDGNLIQIRGSCPKDHICDVGLSKELKNPCVPKSKLREIEICDLYVAIDVPTANNSTNTTTDTNTTDTTTTQSISKTTQNIITTTPQPSTTITQNPAKLFCSKQLATGRYEHPEDPTCTKYIYCFKEGGVMRHRVGTCLKGMYFVQSTHYCETTKPARCT